MALQGSTYNDDYDEPKKPPKRDSFTTELLLMGALAIALLYLLLPGLRTRVIRAFTVGTQQKVNTEVTVWANKDAGYYYCSGSRFYGHTPGSYMKQGDALTLGYQPELGKYCSGGQSTETKQVDGRARLERQAGATKSESSRDRAEAKSAR